MPSSSTSPAVDSPSRVLLIGPYDPFCGEYTFLAPPLGVWRLAGFLTAAGAEAEVFDPNCCEGPVTEEFAAVLRQPWDVIGVSTTGMTLRYDLALAHQARRAQPKCVLVAGGMEATFRAELMFELAPFDLVVLGEGEKPLQEILARLRDGAPLTGIGGTAYKTPDGTLARFHQSALTPGELRQAIFSTPYERMPYQSYWRRLESAYRVGRLPMKADREARLAEIRSVRLITLNYCPMNCSFCSSTNFLHAAQGGVAKLGRLGAEDCIRMMRRIVAAHPDVRTIIFQDDIFVFTNDARILPLCEAIVAAKEAGELPPQLQFISTNRIDAMTPERLAAMRRAGFRVLGFGIENFSEKVLAEFNKSRIYPYIAPMLQAALDLGVTPFLDLILTSPRCSLGDLAETLRQAYHWLERGCEIGMYPYVIPFSGAAMATDPSLAPHTVHSRWRIEGTDVEWDQPAKIPPIDPVARKVILDIEADFERSLADLQTRVAHLPSRVRSLLWIVTAIPHLEQNGESMPGLEDARATLLSRLPGVDDLATHGEQPWPVASLSGSCLLEPEFEEA
ncbi:MAG: cobalamin-dependent protein [Thermoanaerobaculia bacterium]|nr:cobalamin-dependent protein [Thermoanaerobaculia bacterium]